MSAGPKLLAGLGLGALGWLLSEPVPARPPGKPKPPGKPPTKPKPKKPKEPPPTMGDFIDRWPDTFNDTARALLLGRARSGCGFEAQWQTVTSRDDELGELAVRVHAAPLAVDGVYLTSDYQTAQQIADVCGWLMMTPWVGGLISEQASHVTPTTMAPIFGSKAQMLKASRLIRQKQGTQTFIDNGGKFWVLTIRFTEQGRNREGIPLSQAAANFGLFTGPWKPIQTVGLAHGLGYVDYSQMLRYIDRYGTLRQAGKTARRVDLYELVRDPELAALLTGRKGAARGPVRGEGALPYYRHPHVPRARTRKKEGG